LVSGFWVSKVSGFEQLYTVSYELWGW